MTPGSDSLPVDRAPVEALAIELLVALRAHLKERPITQASNFEALNALAFCVATFLSTASGSEHRARAFFMAALENNLKELKNV